MTFARRLKLALNQALMTPSELAERTGLSKSTISQYLSGKTQPSERAIEKISQVLSLDVVEEPEEYSNNMPVVVAAQRLGKCQQFVRIGLQQGVFPFGSAVKLSSKWSYYISPQKFEEYVGGAE